MTTEPIAEVISVLPNKVVIIVNDIEKFKSGDEPLTVGSYIKISDNNDCAIIAIIENFRIDLIKEDDDGARKKKYIVEAMPLGMLDHEGVFKRGGNHITIPPVLVVPAPNADIKDIYDDLDDEIRFCFSKLAQDSTIEVPVNGNKFFNKHIAIIGSTGSGKSNALAKIIQKARDSKNTGYDGLNNSHVVIFDIHSEYRTAFPGASYLTINNLIIPYWLLNSEELEDLFIESNEEQSHNQISVLKQSIIENKKLYFSGPADEKEKLHYDSPVFFNISEVIDSIKKSNSEMVPGTGATGYKQGPLYGKLTNFITRLENKVQDVRLEFMFGNGTHETSLEKTLKQFLSYNDDNKSNITIIDLSGIPFEVLSITVSLISRILFDFSYYCKKIDIDMTNKVPLLVVFEEAHKYAPKDNLSKYNASKNSIERIAKEGRKYGVTLVILSQRPSEISETIFSQCNNFIAMRLTNPDDQNFVKRLLPDSLGSLTETLPSLQAGEAILTGDSVPIPSLVRIDECTEKPSSNDIEYFKEWKKEWVCLDFQKIVDNWKK